MTQEPKHSPLPWTIEVDGSSGKETFRIYASDGYEVDYCHDLQMVDAKLIVSCVNRSALWDEMLERFKQRIANQGHSVDCLHCVADLDLLRRCLEAAK